MNDCKLKEWRERRKVKKIILFGAGSYGKQFIERNSDFINDNFLFCDSDPDKWGNVVSEVKIVSFGDVKRLYEDGEVGRIIITTARVGEIFEQCLQDGIAEQNIYFYDITTNAIKMAREAYAVSVFSQDGEETYLREFFGDRKDGFYVDVGAYDPFRFSNTAWAYERGWKGINIEPNIEGFKKFVQIRNRDINLNHGISEEEGVISYFEFDEGAYNTFCQEIIPENLCIKRVNKITTKRLDRVFEECGVNHIDFLDIDVEGYELSVLNSNDWNLYRPTIVLIEQKIKMEEILKSDVYYFMKDKGYEAVSKYNRTVIYKEQCNGKQ